ncbi:MAG: CCA tRNA nucleotidyltransferase [Oscillatoriaceae bacterium SKW80]|nr:CCA tRNA nucleotidyltransferase [Oscillatoriaceae bacterium SKYG93]MCX8119969.1 CCA tRNA nucleotidyltransferase [Oscillatoriaceae bacterium SKW80]MDW8454130.1 CCA tRNA nucleotidyltransferase [Oscillatoriaceae cyanobacterium SKYGB_i_bin93]HIK29555.1 CCA tRNA nucleotidyltransferase [Oscillatoriaceae cyanobacterium M7585_C2015_266]
MSNLSPFACLFLSPENWPFSREWLPQPTYLVGGAVRDALLRRQSEYLDLDFVMPDLAVQTASKIAAAYKVGFVLLDEARQIARVVFEKATADFAQQEGASLEEDLRRRDFTVNAIAYNPYTEEFTDPLQGCADIQARTLRMISRANLEDDPLRLLRAYRLAAQLGFTIEPATRKAIRELAPLLASVAAERVRTELSFLLAIPEGNAQLQAAWEDGVLQIWFQSATREGLALLAEVDRAAALLRGMWPALAPELLGSVLKTVKTSRVALAKLVTLLAPEPALANQQLLQLKYSRAEIRAALAVIKYLPQLRKTSPTVREQYFMFRELGDVFPALAVLAVAAGVPLAALAPLVERYLSPDDPVVHPVPLLSGETIMSALQLSPGPQVGELLTAIAIARAEGCISTPEEALQLAARLHAFEKEKSAATNSY